MDVRFEIEKFVETKENNGSLMITGNWGCGKTYLVKQITKSMEENYIFVFCSLFGIDSVDSLHIKIKEKLFYEKMFHEKSEKTERFVRKAKNVINPITAVAGEFSNVAKGINTALSVSIYDFVRIEKEIFCRQNKEQVIKQLVLIFDDLERSKLEIIDVLGVINDYSENKEIKTIVIADEDRIKDLEYKNYKEKLIARTVKLTPDYGSIIQSIVNNYNETEYGYKNFLQEEFDVIYQVFDESSSENLRSLKSYLMDFERVFSACAKCQNSKIDNSKLLYMFGAMLFGAKSGKYIEGEYGFLFADSELRKQYTNWDNSYALKSLKDWIVAGVWSEADFCDEITQKFITTELELYQKFLYSDFYDLENADIVNGFSDAVKKSYNGELSGDEIIALLVKIHAFKQYDMDLPCQIDYCKMDNGLELRKNKIKLGIIQEPKSHSFAFVDNIDNEARSLYKKVEDLAEKVIAYKNEQMFVSFLEGKNDISERSLKGVGIESFNKDLLELFLSAYKCSNNSKKRELAVVLYYLDFNNRYYSSNENKKNTIENLKLLIEAVGEIIKADTDQISVIISKHLIKNINEVIKTLNVI